MLREHQSCKSSKKQSFSKEVRGVRGENQLKDRPQNNTGGIKKESGCFTTLQSNFDSQDSKMSEIANGKQREKEAQRQNYGLPEKRCHFNGTTMYIILDIPHHIPSVCSCQLSGLWNRTQQAAPSWQGQEQILQLKSSPGYSYLSSPQPASHQPCGGIQVAQKAASSNQSRCTELNTLCLTVCFSCFHSRCLSRQKAGNICSLLLAGRMHTGGKSAEQKGTISPYICVRDTKKTSQGKHQGKREMAKTVKGRNIFSVEFS